MPPVRHYIKILPWVEAFARRYGAVAPDWAAELFNDVTESGTAITYVPLAPNERGPRIGLCGDRFFVEAGRDFDRRAADERTDSLFVSRVEPADVRLPNSQPKRYEAEFRLLLGHHKAMPRLDPVPGLFGPASLRTEGSQPTVSPPIQAASARLLSFLSEAPSDLRMAWRPRVPLPAEVEPRAFLAPLRRPWVRFALHRYSTLEAREDGLLRHNVIPEELSSTQRQRLLGAFDLRLINAFAATNRRELVHDLLRALAPLNLPTSLRASIWVGTLRGLDGTLLRRELYESVEQLRELIEAQGSDADWSATLVLGLREVAEQNGDGALREVLLGAVSTADILGDAVTWALSLTAPDGEQSLSETTDEASSGIRLEPPREPTAETTIAVPQERLAPLTANRPPTGEQRWLLRVLPDALPLERSVRHLGQAAAALSDADFHDPEQFVSNVATLRSAQQLLGEYLEAVPSLDALEKEIAAAREAYRCAHVALGVATDAFLEEYRELTAPELRQISALLEDADFLAALPGWLLSEVLTLRAGCSAAPHLWAQALTNAWLREALEKTRRQAAEFGAEGQVWLSQIAARPDQAKLDDHLSSEVDRLLAQWSSLAPDERHEVTTAIANGVPLSGALQWQRKLAELVSRIAPSVHDRMTSVTRALPPAERLAAVEEFLAKVEALEHALDGTVVDATYDQITRAKPRARSEARGTGAVYELSIEHDYTDIPRTRAPLALEPHPDASTRPYAFVSLPLLIESTSRRECTLKWDVTVTSKHQAAWSSDWDRRDVSPLHLKEADWREPTEGTGFIFAHELRLPVRVDASPLSLEVLLSEAETGRVVSQKRVLSWDVLRLREDRIAVSWDERPNPNAVREHPIGPQKKVARILDRLAAAGSFAITAPRRFGKTSLVKYLHETAGSMKFVCPDPIVCTSYVEGGRVNYARLWHDVSMRLQSILGSSLKGAFDAELPAADAFSDVRRAARKQKKDGILLLFDEAQLLFPRSGGTEIGFRLKDLIEWHWATATRADGAPVVFGLVGLPDLTTRGGANLAGLLRTEDASEMDEKDLNSLLLGVTRKRLYTTREARFRLARSGSNLYLVKLLLDDLVDRANSSGRTWINFNDVAYVENQVVRRLEEGYADTNVGLWVRDALNDAEDVNYWQPMASFPVALALARVRHEGIRGTDRIRRRSLELLNSWCADLPAVTAVPHYDDTRLTEHLETLRDRRIFLGGEFQSRFLEAWLVGQGREGYPLNARAALMKGATLRVKVPSLLQPVGRGAQASLFRCVVGDDQFAVRKVELPTDRDRAAFLDSIQTLQKLTEPHVKREPGCHYLFDLEVIGFSEGDDSSGVQMYRWIDGDDLQNHIKSLSAALVADLGSKLTQGLRVLERHGILHRDIAPRNIVLSTADKRPVLIDFGFARLDQAALRTNFTSEFAAPEVQGADPQWSRAADVYGLGRTLQALLRPDQSHIRLNEVLAACTAPDRSQRPDVAGAQRLFDEIRMALHVDDTRNAFWEKLTQRSGADREKAWFWSVVEKFKERFQAFPLGLHADPFDRAVEIGDFFNQLFEAFPRGRNEKRLELGYVKQINQDTGDAFATPGVDFLHRLRTYRSHSGGARVRSRAEMLSAVGSPSQNQMVEHVMDTSIRMASFLDIQTLPHMSEFLLQAGVAIVHQ